MALRKWISTFTARLRLMGSVKNWRELRSILDGSPAPEIQWLTLRRGGVLFGVNSREQLNSMKECLIDRVYTRLAGGIGKDWTVVDIGAAVGGFTIEAARSAVDGKVIAFEPNMGSINMLRQNVRANQLNNVEAHNLGVWDRDAEMPLCICDDYPLMAQTNEGEMEARSDTHDTLVPVISLKTLVQEKVSGKIDLMKLDCEGAEYSFLLNQPAGLFARIRRIVLEYHDRENERAHADLKSYLETVGYKVRVFGNPIDKTTGYLSAIRVGLGSVNELE